MQHFDFSVAPGGAQQVTVQGSYVYYLSGSAGGVDDTITLKNLSGSDEVILRPGQSFDLGREGQNVQWLIGNYRGEGTIVGRLLMGDGSFSDNRISGAVEVIDGGKARTLSGMAFAGAFGSVVPAAGTYARVVLFNLAASPKVGIVGAVGLSGTNAVTVNVGRLSSELATAISSGRGKHFKADSGSSNIRASTDSTASTMGEMGYVPTWQLSVSANGKDLWMPREPLVIPPGRGVVLWATVPGVAFAGSFEWFEDAK